MAPTPIPAPLPPWARALLQIAPFIQAGLQEVLQHIGPMSDNSATAEKSWRHVHFVWQLKANTETADHCVTTMDIANITGGKLDDTWTDADYTNVHTELAALATSWLNFVHLEGRLNEVRYYRRAFNPLTETKPFAPSGPPERIFTVNQVGTAGALLQAPQVAVTHTERTPYRRHWGRAYWPYLAPQSVTSTGHVTTTCVDALAAALQTRYANLMAKEFFPVVPVTQVDKAITRGLLTTNVISVDDVPDVQRRRRPKVTTYRKVLPVTP